VPATGRENVLLRSQKALTSVRKATETAIAARLPVSQLRQQKETVGLDTATSPGIGARSEVGITSRWKADLPFALVAPRSSRMIPAKTNSLRADATATIRRSDDEIYPPSQPLAPDYFPDD